MPSRCRSASFRRRAVAAGVAAVLAGLSGTGGAAQAVPISSESSALPAQFDDRSLLVRFAAGVDETDRRAVAGRYGTGEIEPVNGTAFYILFADAGSAAAVRAGLAADRRVAVVEPNYIRQASAVPVDPLYDKNQRWYFDQLRLPEAWDLAPGDDEVVLAVVDSGVDLDHPELAGRLVPGWDVVDDDDEPSDKYKHGTQVASVAAAAVDHYGMAGVAARGRIMPVRVAGDKGKSTDAEVAEGIVWAADHGADVINISMGGPVASGALREAVEHAQARGALVVAAAGNQGDSFPNYPAAFDGVVAVAAVDRHGHRAEFSNYGPWIDVAAPGVEILVASNDGHYYVNEGTSFATPIVAGIALQVRAAFPAESAAQIADRLVLGARDVGPLGFDDYYGAGIVDALGALGYPQARPDVLDMPPDSTPAQARPLVTTNGGVTAGAIAYEGDVDWYTFEMTEPGWRRFGLSGPDGAAPLDFSMTLLNANLGEFEELDEYLLVPGRYYVRVRGEQPNGLPGDYRITVLHGRNPQTFSLSDRDPDREDPLGSPAVSIAAGDVTGDGRADLIVSTGDGGDPATDNGVFVLPNTTAGAGSYALFGAPQRIPADTAGAGMGVALADLDGDGDLDLAVAGNGRVALHLQGPDGLGGPATTVPVAGATQIETGDVDGDGDVDLVAGGPGGVHLLRRSPGGGYEAVGLDATPVAEIEVADMDADGRADVVALLCPADCDTLALLRSSGAGFAHQHHAVPSPRGPEQCVLAVGDTTGDGYRDAFVACDGRPLQAFAGWAGGLGGAAPVPVDLEHVEALETEDFDGDGRHELVAASAREQRLWVLWPTVEQDGWQAPTREVDFRLESAGDMQPKGLTLADLGGDGQPDAAAATGAAGPMTLFQVTRLPRTFSAAWVVDTVPADGSSGAAPHVQPTVRINRTVPTTPPSPVEVTLRDGRTGRPVPASAAYDPANNSVVVHPAAPLTPGRAYSVELSNVRDSHNSKMPSSDCCFRFVVGHLPGSNNPLPGGDPPVSEPTDPPVGPATKEPARSGYWLIDGDGTVYGFGAGGVHGHGDQGAVDLEPTPTGNGYWILHRNGVVARFGDAVRLGNVDRVELTAGEEPASLSATPSGRGYWVFTNRGRALAFGDAVHLGDMSRTRLNGPVLDSVATPTGLGYYMVAGDGGIFAFGDAAFAGSMGGTRLNAPVQSLVPDGDGDGYWLVASDGGIFAFDAPFRGSMGATKLNKPVVGMVRYGDGYLMVGADGGVFNFSSLPFSGSLGDRPPASPVVAVAARP